jgi:hypothetical protein
MRSTLPLVIIAAAIAASGCGPSVGEARLTAAPARAENCDLDFLQLTINDVAPGGRYELLGHVVLSQEGVRDPLDPKYRAAVRPRACAMGGEGVAILMTGTATPWALSAGGTTIDYAVVRKHRADKPAPPQKF